jgi:hypothetical protein
MAIFKLTLFEKDPQDYTETITISDVVVSSNFVNKVKFGNKELILRLDEIKEDQIVSTLNINK